MKYIKKILAIVTVSLGLSLTGLGVYVFLEGQVLALFHIVAPGGVLSLAGIALFLDGRMKDFFMNIFIWS